MGSLRGPAPPGLEGGGGALVRDLAGEAQVAQRLAGDAAVVAGVQVAGPLIRQHAAELARGGPQGGDQQRGVMAGGARAGGAPRGAAGLWGPPALQPAPAPGPPGRPGALPTPE